MNSVCIIITGLSTGGAEAMLFKLLQHLDRNRFTAQVISLSTKGEIGPRIEALGVPVQALGMRPGLPNPGKCLRLIMTLRKMKPDVVQTWMYHADLVGGLSARLAGIRAVVWGVRHSNLSPSLNKQTTLRVMHVCASLSRWLPCRILSCSERARSIHVAAGYDAGKISIIPNGFDLEHFVPDEMARDSVREEFGLPGDALLVGLIARDDPQKNHAGFIEAAARVKNSLPNVHFLLAGMGIDEGNKPLVLAIERAGLQNRVHLLGQRDDIPRLMAGLDVLASSSHGEAFPNVLGEAMACGIPCVVTDVGDSADIVGDTGRVVASGDMADLARRLIELLELPIEQRSALGRRARERVRERYEIGEVVRRFEAFWAKAALANER